MLLHTEIFSKRRKIYAVQKSQSENNRRNQDL